MGSGHIDSGLCDALTQLLHTANTHGPPGTVDVAITSLADNCSASELTLERLRVAALETHVHADRRRRRESELQALLRVAQQLLASATLDESLDAVVTATQALLSADVAHINIQSGDGGDYHSVRAIQGEMTEAFRRQRTPPGAGLTGLVTETKSPYVSTDYLSDPRIRHSASGDASVRSDGLRTLAGVPVLHRDDVIAVLIVSYRVTTSMSDDQLRVLVSLATLAGLAVEDARKRDSQAAISRKLQGDSRLLEARNASLAWSGASYEELVDLVLRRCGVSEFISAVSNAFGCEAAMCDAQGVLLAAGPASSALTLPHLSGIAEDLGQLATTSAVIQLGEDADPLWLCVVASKEEVLGAIYIRRDVLDDVAQLTFGRIGRLASELLRELSSGGAPGELDEGTVESLLDGRTQDDFASNRSRSLGPLVNKSVVAVVAIADPAMQSRMHHFGVRIACEYGGIGGSQDGRLVLFMPGADAAALAARVQSSLTASLGSPVVVGASLSAGLSSLQQATAEALRCARCLQRMGHSAGSGTVQSLGQIGLLLGSESEDTMAEFITTSIGPLLEYDKERRSELVRTLQAYLAHNSSLKTAASELHVHPNTVLQRLQKISALLKDDGWRRQAEKRLDLQVALRLHGMSALRP